MECPFLHGGVTPPMIFHGGVTLPKIFSRRRNSAQDFFTAA
jgi:hypothetical protein